MQLKSFKSDEELLTIRHDLQESQRYLEIERDALKKMDALFNELNKKYEEEKQARIELTNQKKELADSLASLEKQVFNFFKI